MFLTDFKDVRLEHGSILPPSGSNSSLNQSAINHTPNSSERGLNNRIEEHAIANEPSWIVYCVLAFISGVVLTLVTPGIGYVIYKHVLPDFLNSFTGLDKDVRKDDNTVTQRLLKDDIIGYVHFQPRDSDNPPSKSSQSDNIAISGNTRREIKESKYVSESNRIHSQARNALQMEREATHLQLRGTLHHLIKTC